MNRVKSFVATSILGGLLVLLPVAVIAVIGRWIYSFMDKMLAPLTTTIVNQWGLSALFVQVLILAVLIMICFFVGVMIKTRLGKWLHEALERKLFKKVPGYSMIKDIVKQFMGEKQSPFSSVALAKPYGNQTLVTSFITDEHDDGSYTVFVPTGPNPTSGQIFHLRKELVFPVELPTEDAMRSILSCGAGSKKLMNAYRKVGKTGPA